MALPDVPANYKRYRTNIATADTTTDGSLFFNQVVENEQIVDLPDVMFGANGYPVESNNYLTGILTGAIDGTYVINEWLPSTDAYTPRNFTFANTVYQGYVAGDVLHKYYPINSGGNIVMNDANAFDTVDEIIAYLNDAPGSPFTSYALIAQIQFVEV